MFPDPGRRIISVGGGKGGVGKSVVVANLATMMARHGARVVVLDADVGAPNLHSFFGIHRPGRTIEDFFRGDVDRLVDLALETPVPRLQILCGAPEVLGSAIPQQDARLRLVRALNTLDCDCLMIDVGAGVDLSTLDFFNAADVRLVVMTPEITSIENGYGFLKMALYRRLQRAIESTDAAGRLFAALGGRAFEIGSRMESIETFLTVVGEEAPELVDTFRLLVKEFNVLLIGNMVAERREQDTLVAVKRVIRDRLSLDAPFPVMFWSDARVRASLAQGKPLALGKNTDANINGFVTLSKKLLLTSMEPIRELRRQISAMLVSADRSFAFGLQALATPNPVAGAPPDSDGQVARPAPETLEEALERTRRQAPRQKTNCRVQVKFHSAWHLARMTELSSTSACLLGVRAQPGWGDAQGLLRLIQSGQTTPELPVVLHSYNESSDRLVVRFASPLDNAALRLFAPDAARGSR